MLRGGEALKRPSRAPVVAAALAAMMLTACPSERLPGYFEPVPLEDASERPVLDRPDGGTPTSAPGDAGEVARDSAGELPPQTVEPDEDRVPSFAALFKRLKPSVVNIYTQEVVMHRLATAPLFGLPDDGPDGTSLGSGIVIDDEGHILTNAHVVENAAEIRVRFYDEGEMPARLVGLDPVRDLALLKVDGATDLVPVVPGDSAALEVGEWVVAIGNPFGLSHTITKGIVSGKGRSEFVNDKIGYLDLIQTDAAINQGSSGGPLFDMAGRVVGINTAMNAEGHGIGFAIGWDAVEEALPRLLQGGQVSRSWLGVYVKQDGDESDGRVLVDAVVEESPAAKAGVAPGDLVQALDGRPVRTVAEFRLRVASAVAGRDMTIDVERRGLPLQLSARLEEARDIR